MAGAKRHRKLLEGPQRPQIASHRPAADPQVREPLAQPLFVNDDLRSRVTRQFIVVNEATSGAVSGVSPQSTERKPHGSPQRGILAQRVALLAVTGGRVRMRRARGMIETADFLDGPAFSFTRQPLLADLFGDVADTTTSLTVVFGAGVSMNSSLPSWSGLLDNMARGLRDKRISRMALSDRADPLRRAERLLLLSHRGDMRTQSFEPVRNALYPADFEPQPGEMAQAIARLAAVAEPRTRLMTTNFDPLVETALEALRGETPSHSLDTKDEWRGCVARGELAVMHVHGLIQTGWQKAETLRPLILSESHFLQYGQEVRDLVTERLGDSTVVFVGVSLTDPNLVGSCFNWAQLDARTYNAYALVVPDSVAGAESDEEEFEYNRHSAQFLYEQLGLRPIFLKSYAQVTQVVSDLALCCARPDEYRDADPGACVRYGHRFARILERAYSNLGIDRESDTPSPSIAAVLARRMVGLMEADDGLLAQLMEWTRLLGRGQSGPPEEFGVFLWLRSREHNAPDSPYSLSLVANSVYAYHSPRAGRRVVPIRRDSSYAAALAVYRGSTTASNPTPSPGFSMWRGVYAVPLAVEAGDIDAEIANTALDRVTIGCVTLTTSRPVTANAGESSGDATPVSVLQLLQGEDSSRLSDLLIALAGRLISG